MSQLLVALLCEMIDVIALCRQVRTFGRSLSDNAAVAHFLLPGAHVPEATLCTIELMISPYPTAVSLEKYIFAFYDARFRAFLSKSLI